MRMLIALCVALFLSFAAAMNLPSDADIFVTAEDGTIVGIGKTVGGAEFELELLAGFEGFARLLMITPGGDTHAFDVMVNDGSLFVDLVDLADIVREAGFADHRVFADDVSARPGVTGRPDDVGGSDAAADAAEAAHEGMGNASETGNENAGDAPNDAADAGARNADDAGDNAADPDDLPAPPVDPPSGGQGGGRP